MTMTYRKDIQTAEYYIQIQEALKELPESVIEDLSAVHAELKRLDEAALSGEQIQAVFANIAKERGQGGDVNKIAKKLAPAMQGLMDNLMSSKAATLLQKIGNAVPIEKLNTLVKKLPEPAGSKASTIVDAIRSGAEQIENDEDVAAFKGLMLTVITIGMGALGVGGPAALGVISSAALFRVVVNSAIKAAAGGTVKDIAKGAAVDLAKAAAAALAGMAINKLGEFVKGSAEEAGAAADRAVEAGRASQQEIAQTPPEELVQSGYTATGFKLPPNLELSDYNEAISSIANPIVMNGGTYDLDAIKQVASEALKASGGDLDDLKWNLNRWLIRQMGYAVGSPDTTQNTFDLFVSAGLQGEGPLADLASAVAQESVMHPEWITTLSEEIGVEFDELAESVGPEVAVFATLTWYNSWVKENQPIIEGMQHLQQYQLVENVEKTIKEAPAIGDIAKKVGGAYRKATGAVGKVAGKALGGAKAAADAASNVLATGLGKLVKPVLNTGPAKAFTNKIQQVTGTQSAIDPAKLQQDYEAAGSPTDDAELSKFLSKNAGATKGEIDSAYKASGVQAQAPEEQPEQDAEEPAATTQQQGAQAQEPAQQGQDSGATQAGAQGATSGAAGAPKAGAKPQPNAVKQGVNQTQPLKVGDTATFQKNKFKWDGQNWIGQDGQPAIGKEKQELMKSKGLDITGKPAKPGMMQRAKDWIAGKDSGYGQATRSDPKASLGKKIAGTLGSMVGGALAGGKPSAEQPAQAPQSAQAPQAPQAPQAGAEQPAGKKPLPNVTKSEYSALQKRTMSGDAAAAKELVDRLSNANSKNYDINDYANSIGAILKRSNIDANLKTTLTQKARALRTEAYQHLTKVLEAGGLTWSDLGYHAVISESNNDTVLLVPVYDVDMYEMKQLAGI